MKPVCLTTRSWDAATLVTQHPPRLHDPQKRAVAALIDQHAVPVSGTIRLSHWRAEPLPELVNLVPVEPIVVPGTYDYAVDPGRIWHVNFADPDLFFAYGSSLLAQDELQVLEHPTLGSVREALIAEGLSTFTVDDDRPMPMLITGAQRRCALETEPTPTRPAGLYGAAFSRASPSALAEALRFPDPAPVTDLIVMAAPAGGRGDYKPAEIDFILSTAYAGFSAAASLSDDEEVEIRTGFWGCGAFGGDRVMMVVLQVLAACMVGVDRLVFYTYDEAGEADVAAGLAAIAQVQPRNGEPWVALRDRLVRLGRRWGTSNGT